MATPVKLRPVLLFILLILSVNFCYAGEPRSLSLREAVEIALTRNLGYQGAKENLKGAAASRQIEKARYRPKQTLEVNHRGSESETLGQPDSETNAQSESLRITQEWLIPSLGARPRLDFGVRASQDRSGPIGSITGTDTFGPELTLTWRQPLSRSGRITETASQQQANLSWSVAQIGYNLKTQDILFETVTIYFGLLRARYDLLVARALFSRTREQLATAKAQVKAGVLAEIEQLRLAVRVAIEESSLVASENREASSRRALLIFLDLSPSTDLVLTSIPQGNTGEALDLDALIAMGLAQRLDLAQLMIQQEQQEMSLAQAQSANQPILTMSGSYGESGRGSSLHEAYSQFKESQTSTYNVSAGLSWPMFDSGATRAQVDRAKSDRAALDFTIEDRKRRIALEIEEAFRDMETAQRRQKLVEANIAVSEEALRVDEIRFAKGLITSIELLGSQNALFQLRRDRDASLIDQTLNRLRLLRVTGTLTVETL